jgi:MtrB/PioB family decaheme-associated outer membrane protein
MRTVIKIALAALLATFPGVAHAQTDIAPTAAPGSIDLGLRFTDISGDPARFQRFRDIGDGTLVDKLRFNREEKDFFFRVGADHLGRQDQRYWAEYGGRGSVKIRFQWDQIPLFISQDTRTLYSVQSPGVLQLSDSMRQSIQAGSATLANFVGGASPFDVRSRRDAAQLNFVYSATRDVDVKVNFKTTRRDGTMPLGASFGFNDDVELAAPIDTRTTDLNAGVEWANTRGSLRIGYDGSWFDNHVQTLVWDNPLRITDTTFTGAYASGLAGSQGRYALWPSSNMQGVNTAASLKLPADTRVSGNITVGGWHQNQPLPPFTINTAIPVVPLDRATTEGEVRTLAMNYTATSRPNQYLWLSARYRYYDFDNRTPPFDAGKGKIALDQARSEEGDITPILSSARHNLDVDASFTPIPFTALRVGYGRETVDRTERIFARTTDDIVRASIDTTAGWVTLRGIVEHAARRGSGFDRDLLVELGEQPTLQHFDIADRDRDRVTALLQVTPAPSFGFSASAATGKDDYKNSGFGLRNNENRTYTFTADLTPIDEIAAGVFYTFEKYTALQNSRQASPGAQFLDPTRNWSIDSADRARTLAANLDLLKLLPRTEVRFAYNYSRSTAAYVYGAPATSTLATLVQLPTVMNELRTGTADLRYFVTQKFAVGVVYWHDQYRVDDFALGPDTINRLDLPGSLFLGYLYRPYTANSAWVRLMYFW